MRWQEMTGDEVKAFAEVTDVALLPVGCVEMHGPHLPTGCDAYVAEKLADMVAAREPCIVLPTLYYNVGQMQRTNLATIAIPADVVVSLYEAICDEAARNGFHKIAILICHGSSEKAAYHLQDLLFERNRREDCPPKPYKVFVLYDLRGKRLGISWDDLWETPPGKGGHGSESETSMAMAARPDLVHLDRLEPLPEGEGEVHRQTIPAADYQVDFVKVAPKGYCGWPHLATRQKGEEALTQLADGWAKVIRQIRDFDIQEDI